MELFYYYFFALAFELLLPIHVSCEVIITLRSSKIKFYIPSHVNAPNVFRLWLLDVQVFGFF